MKNNLKKILMLFNPKEKKKLISLFFLMIIAALLETVGIGLIIPFVGIITNPEIIHEQSALLYIFELFNFQSTTAFIIFSVVIFLSVFVLKNLYLLFFYYAQYRVIFNQQVRLSSRLFKEYLKKPYTFHLQRNTAELLRNVNGEVPKVFQGIILSTFQLLTEILVITCILILLLFTAPIATITASILLGSSVIIFFNSFRKKITSLGKEQQKVGSSMIKWVNQGLGASKEVKVSGKENFFINSYKNKSQIQANNNRYMRMLEQVPRLFIETLIVSIVFITMLIIILQGTNTTQIVSTMALFAMAAFRLMPSINRVIAMITTIKYSQPALEVVYEDLFENTDITEIKHSINLFEKSDIGGRKFKDSLQLKDVSFRYPNQREYSIKDVSLTIPIGHSAAFIGESGAGKTTVVDILLGLLYPEKGKVIVDGKSLFEQKLLWQQKIGYIPQSIYLSDDTIRGNVAFGLDSDCIDDEQVWYALEQAHLKEFVMSLPDQLDTHVGERGVRLSGGQRQRIGIARALYHNPEILFMDEATSALDIETEKEIMKAIDGLKGEKTLIIIAHRLSTIENCDTVFKMSKGRLVSVENKNERSVL
ncbi:ABC transporter ATP-binding protein [Alkalihalobacterium chitinilyticum]|uniref:ABC transporter ATP-binding protein/permease n=1 Tax=Alkalihalobacterium chitinilyticum TaxID=2980103 RepID=A0ABT5VGE1_9BACI|nr:ABC transporter ATP-binding protein [Alkalihalobacterium chitinilyticum]MDE5413802.1 ABC transporter ATP-binding protein/permease [Alkalihalobacterium chitinilyticum]